MTTAAAAAESEPRRPAALRFTTAVFNVLLAQWLIIGFGIACILAYFFPRTFSYPSSPMLFRIQLSHQPSTPRCRRARRHHPLRVQHPLRRRRLHLPRQRPAAEPVQAKAEPDQLAPARPGARHQLPRLSHGGPR